MSDDIVVRADCVSKKFSRGLKHVMMYGVKDIARNMVGLSAHSEILREGEFWAVDDVSFELRKGETLGLIGPNGSGKSTLLKMLNGIFMPDKGKIEIKGRVGALIEVGAGFHPMLTGRENIYINGSILGMSKREIDQKFDEIVEFADIGEFIDAPVKHYSSGMYVRLGFSVAIHCKPDILLVDEVLSVGDAKFQRKCLDRLIELKNEGVSFILVSHNMQVIEGAAGKAILLSKGKKLNYGSAAEVITQYDLMMRRGISFATEFKPVEEADNGGLKLVKRYAGFGTDEIVVKNIWLLDDNNLSKKIFSSDENLVLEVELEAKKNIENAVLWISFIDSNKVVCLGGREILHVRGGLHKIKLKFDPIQLTTGNYKLAFHMFDESFTHPYTQGHYGYFQVKKNIPTPNPGKGTPLCWKKWTVL